MCYHSCPSLSSTCRNLKPSFQLIPMRQDTHMAKPNPQVTLLGHLQLRIQAEGPHPERATNVIQGLGTGPASQKKREKDFQGGDLRRGPQDTWRGESRRGVRASICQPSPAISTPHPPLTGTGRPKSVQGQKSIVLQEGDWIETVEGLAGLGTTPSPLTWAGGPEARAVPPPSGGRW